MEKERKRELKRKQINRQTPFLIYRLVSHSKLYYFDYAADHILQVRQISEIGVVRTTVVYSVLAHFDRILLG